MHEGVVQIKERMLQKAARSWNLPDLEGEAALDPLVSMLFSACALELSNVVSEVNETQTRVTEKLIEIMSPDINMGVLPSHSLACATPAESGLYVTPLDLFYITKERHDKRDSSQLCFSPISKFKLLSGQVEYMLHIGGLLKSDKNTNWVQALPAHKIDLPEANELWLGFRFAPEISQIGDLSVCFDYKGISLRKLFYYLLKNTTWSYNNQTLPTKSGLIKQHEVSINNLFGEKSNVHRSYLAHIANYYSERFINVSFAGQPILREIPSELKDTFKKLSKEIITDAEGLMWVKVVFPRANANSVLKELNCAINIFPVANLSFETKVFKSRKHLNIFALNDENFFFDIESIEDGNGKIFRQSIAEKILEIEDDFYIIRGEGVESYDTRLASEHITRLLEKLKNESAAFNFLDMVPFNNDLKTLHQIISKLESYLDDLPQFASKVYLFLNSKAENIPIHIAYWSTMGDIAQVVKPRTPMFLYQGTHVLHGGCVMFTSSIRGRSKMNREDRLNSYKTSLLYRNKIVTNEDLKVFCKSYLGARLSDINIGKGIAKEFSNKEGFVRTIDLHIDLAEYENPTIEELMALCKDMLITLEEKSTSIFPFRFFINKQHIDV